MNTTQRIRSVLVECEKTALRNGAGPSRQWLFNRLDAAALRASSELNDLPSTLLGQPASYTHEGESGLYVGNKLIAALPPLGTQHSVLGTPK